MATTDNDAFLPDALKQEIVGVYNRASSLYDQVGIKQFTYFGNLLIDKLDLPLAAQILDVATGRGALLLAAAEKIGPQGHILGIDLAPGMIAATAAEIRARHLSQAEVRLMDADTASFPDGSFDYILCALPYSFSITRAFSRDYARC